MNQTDTIKQVAIKWTRIQPSIGRFIRSFVRNRSDAEDVIQEVALNVLESADNYDPKRPFSGWAFTIARRTVTNHLRRRYRDQHLFGSESFEHLATAHQNLNDRKDEMVDALEQCIANVSGRNRKILHLRYREGLAIKKIGERLSMSANAVTVALHRLRDTLRSCVSNKLDQSPISMSDGGAG